MYDSIIFDVDGTLWDTTSEAASAFRELIKNKYPEVTDDVTPDKLKSLFGLLIDDIAVRLFKSVPAKTAIKIMRECCDYEIGYLLRHRPKMYDGMEEAIKELSKDYKLLIVSNCEDGYIQCLLRLYPQLEKYITDYEYPGRSGLPKAENIKLVIERNHLKNPVYVGDTKGDAASAKKAGIPFIYARYGFGQVEEYDAVIDSPLDLLKILKQ